MLFAFTNSSTDLDSLPTQAAKGLQLLQKLIEEQRKLSQT